MKIRSSKELKESMKNLDNVVNFKDDEVEVHSDMDIVMTAAYDEDIKAEEHIEEVKKELEQNTKDIIPENPEAPMPEVKQYTGQLKLDEDLEDFDLKDGRSRKVPSRGADEGNRYLSYDMFEFVSELLTGKDCNTNPAPITPIVWRRDPKTKKFKYMEMKKFMTQGEDSVSYSGSNISGSFQIEDEDDNLANATDTDGMYKGLGVPQIGFEGDAFRVYSNSLEDLEQAQQGLSHYGIKYDQPVHKLSKMSHWNYSMKVYIPMNNKGDFLTLTEWLRDTGRHVEDVMRPNFVKNYNKLLNKQYSKEDSELVRDIFNSYVTKKNNDFTLDTDVLLKDMFDELEGLPYDKDSLEAEFRAEVEAPTYYDVFDKYVDLMETDPSQNPKKVFSMMIKELKANKIKFKTEEVFTEFMSEIE